MRVPLHVEGPESNRVVALVPVGGAPPPAVDGELRVLLTPEGVRACVEEWSPDAVVVVEPDGQALPRLAGLGVPLVLLGGDTLPAAAVGRLGVHAWLPASATPDQVRLSVAAAASRRREEAGLRRHEELLRHTLDLASTLAALRTPEDVVAQAVAGFAAVIGGPVPTGAIVVRLGVDDALRFAGVGRHAGLRSDLDLPVTVVEAVARVFGRVDTVEWVDGGVVVGVVGGGWVSGALYVADAELPPGFGTLGGVIAGLVGQALSNTVLFHRSSHDAMTGLCSRAYGLHRLAEVLALASRHPAPTCVMVLDVDLFKRVNDAHGHQGGDVVLAAVADLIRRTIRGTDLAVRLGGEEFLVVLPQTDEAAAAAVAERMRRVVSAWRGEHQGRELAVSVSIGVAEASPGERDVGRLVARADDALYEAQRQGRNRVVRAG